jgi:hypothetical protein
MSSRSGSGDPECALGRTERWGNSLAGIFAFKCSRCDKIHEGSPSIAFDSPWQYATLTDEQKAAIGELTTDLCKIRHDGKADYFIRTVLEVPIHGITEPFTWGVWVSVSEKSFRRYLETYDDPVEGEGFFGWLCNRVPSYTDTIAVPTDVLIRLDGLRPLSRLHRGGDAPAHQLAIDQHEGISVTRAQEIAELAFHRI